MNWYQWDGQDLIINVRVQPRARRDGFADVIGEAIKVQLRAPPVDDKANASLIALLAESFHVPQRAVVIMSGHHARMKRVRITAPQRLPTIVTAPPN
ncbi:YggU family protein [Rhodoferax sp. 4810]|uniref:UPF0235 protein HUK38_11035 n=1 Tax=Thiospirillum jenense TaxID=1653858 RepID=A0A839HIN3_9GAMM|nr:DUF167 family protein [Thiospirillum jenense]MBB1075109.1 YggU family protein [Rhodoferax jenense]MBB1126758.1 YggU family protein [Thiospirillum jenense]